MKRHERLLSRAHQAVAWFGVSLAITAAAVMWTVEVFPDGGAFGVVILGTAIGSAITVVSNGARAAIYFKAALDQERWDHDRAIRPRL